MNNKCGLFSAPHSFLGELKEKYNSILPTDFYEMWDRSDLNSSDKLQVWIVNPGQKFVIDKDIIKLFPNLELIITPSTGKNHIDEQHCKSHRIAVHSLLDVRDTLGTITASSEFTFLLILNALRRSDFAVKEVAENRWRDNEEKLRGYELCGKSIGIIGLGRIGSNIAKWCEAFDAKVSYFDPYVNSARYSSISIKNIFSKSDIICVSCTLTEDTKGFINQKLLSQLKHNASLINTSGGEIINEADLIDIINNREDINICLDVLSGEVTNSQFSSPLVELHRKGRITITPHIAGATYDSQIKAAKGALELLKHHYDK